jgi:hypothetical protein
VLGLFSGKAVLGGDLGGVGVGHVADCWPAHSTNVVYTFPTPEEAGTALALALNRDDATAAYALLRTAGYVPVSTLSTGSGAAYAHVAPGDTWAVVGYFGPFPAVRRRDVRRSPAAPPVVYYGGHADLSRQAGDPRLARVPFPAARGQAPVLYVMAELGRLG